MNNALPVMDRQGVICWQGGSTQRPAFVHSVGI